MPGTVRSLTALVPNVVYNSIKLNGADILLYSSGTKVSFQAPYNAIEVKFTSDVPLSQFRIRVTRAVDPYDVNLGACPVAMTNLSANTQYTCTVPINDTYFGSDGNYRIGLYAQNAQDLTWDMTYIFCALDGGQFKPKSSDNLIVYSDKSVTT